MKTLNYCTFSLYALTLGFLVISGSVLAQNQKKSATREARSDQQTEARDVAIPTCLDKLTLTPEQQDQIKGIVREYDGDIESAWQQFGKLYLDSVRTEVLLLSAIEDNLTEAQRGQVRQQRRKTARREKSVEGTEVNADEAKSPTPSAVEQQIEIVGVSLTSEQELAADKLQETYLSHLRSLNRDIQGLHIQLVSLEADKLVEIENVLTKDQLTQLRETRKTAPGNDAATASRTSPARNR